ncbi:MAG: DEAD/DEAH box helicase [Thiotrichales bacterium]
MTLPFSLPTLTWFNASFAEPTRVQREGWAAIASGQHALLVAPTGSGKTLAAFLWGIDRLLNLDPAAADGVRVLYVSPLKALVYDVERNLRAPLVGVERAAERLGRSGRQLRVDVRTGDTPQKLRQQQLKTPAEILVTTPESLFLLLGSRARETLRMVHTVIVDEVHALAPTKRGVHLALSLERLTALCEREPQRIGLSATVRPLDEAARFLGGDRAVTCVDASAKPALDLRIVVPVPDMERLAPPPRETRGGSILAELYTREVTPRQEQGIWSAIYPRLLDAIRAHRSTLVFVNSRGLCERLTQRLNELADEDLVRAHHGSVSHEKRAEIEERLKLGAIRGIVATSSLELGIDMGAIEQVILVESPGAVARGLQRVGRAGHQVGAVSVGRIYPKFRGDLLECAVVAGRMLAGEIESIQVPRNVLDVLAQQLVAMVCDTPRTVVELERIVRRAWPYRELSRGALEATLDMLAGRYPSSDFADLRPLLVWDRATDSLSPRKGAALLVRLNAGTIPDRGLYAVHLGADGARLGELDEEMVFETKPGDNILLGASTWHVEQITRDRVIVSPAPGEPGRLPFWRGDGPGRPIELGRALGAFLRELDAQPARRASEWLTTHAPLDAHAAENLARYIQEQKAHTGTLPTDRAITLERFRDELGDWRVCLLSPFGARVHAPWAMVLQRQLSQASGIEVQTMYSDDGIVLRCADVEELPDFGRLLVPDPEDVDELLREQLPATALFAALFRENAARALLMPRRRADGRSPLWMQRLKAQQLLAGVAQYANFPIVLETYRQALADVFDVSGFKQLLADLRARRVRVNEVETNGASPFARSLVFAYVANYLYDQDAPLAERKAQALTLDRTLLAELLGQDELRELFDPEVLEILERELQHRAPERRARDADQLHDLLRRLGDLGEAELVERVIESPSAWLQQLSTQRRAVSIRIAGEICWIAAEDAGLYRDALGVAPPSGLPDSFVAPVADALVRLIRRHAQTRGPFLARELAARYDLRVAQVEPALRLLEGQGVLVRGEIRPGGAELDWCDAEILRRLKRRTLARLRAQIAPVDGAQLARFLPEWQGVDAGRSGPNVLLDVIRQLEGLALPWSAWSETVLPARIEGFRADALDLLAAMGGAVWVGAGALGAKDGRVALYRRETIAELLSPPSIEGVAVTPLHGVVLSHLRARGASFYLELEDAARRAGLAASGDEFRSALWDLVWAGLITNDTFAPLRALAGGPRAATPRRAVRLAGGRWALVEQLGDATIDPTRRSIAQARRLLDRYGVVSREAAVAEGLVGGFGPIYQVLKSMEETGQVRRGYFVEGLAGAQFALPGAVERLRAARVDEPSAGGYGDADVRILAAIDPANPYGSLLPWPARGAAVGAGPRRISGAWVILVSGWPVLYASAQARQLTTFQLSSELPESTLALAFRALHRLPRGGRRAGVAIEKVDGEAVGLSVHLAALRAAGFVSDYRGLIPDPRRA